MPQPIISIALCTYNGAAYVRQQIESIAAQAQRPDEIVVCDDHSTDATVDIVREFAARAPFPVNLHVNEQNLGFSQNFAKAVGLTKGDIIFLSDQDDVWREQKIARMVELLERHPQAPFVFCDSQIVDEQLRSAGDSFWSRLQFNESAQERMRQGPFQFLLRLNVVAGATMAFRSSYRPWILPIPHGWLHDHWIALLLSAVAPPVWLVDRLNLYRQHAAQQFGGSERSLWQWFKAARLANRDYHAQRLTQFAALQDRLLAPHAPPLRPTVRRMIEQKVLLCQSRARMRHTPLLRIPLALKEAMMLRYHRYAQGWKSFVADLLM